MRSHRDLSPLPSTHQSVRDLEEAFATPETPPRPSIMPAETLRRLSASNIPMKCNLRIAPARATAAASPSTGRARPPPHPVRFCFRAASAPVRPLMLLSPIPIRSSAPVATPVTYNSGPRHVPEHSPSGEHQLPSPSLNLHARSDWLAGRIPTSAQMSCLYVMIFGSITGTKIRWCLHCVMHSILPPPRTHRFPPNASAA